MKAFTSLGHLIQCQWSLFLSGPRAAGRSSTITSTPQELLEVQPLFPEMLRAFSLLNIGEAELARLDAFLRSQLKTQNLFQYFQDLVNKNPKEARESLLKPLSEEFVKTGLLKKSDFLILERYLQLLSVQFNREKEDLYLQKSFGWLNAAFPEILHTKREINRSMVSLHRLKREQFGFLIGFDEYLSRLSLEQLTYDLLRRDLVQLKALEELATTKNLRDFLRLDSVVGSTVKVFNNQENYSGNCIAKIQSMVADLKQRLERVSLGGPYADDQIHHCIKFEKALSVLHTSVKLFRACLVELKESFCDRVLSREQIKTIQKALEESKRIINLLLAQLKNDEPQHKLIYQAMKDRDIFCRGYFDKEFQDLSNSKVDSSIKKQLIEQMKLNRREYSQSKYKEFLAGRKDFEDICQQVLEEILSAESQLLSSVRSIEASSISVSKSSEITQTQGLSGYECQEIIKIQENKKPLLTGALVVHPNCGLALFLQMPEEVKLEDNQLDQIASSVCSWMNRESIHVLIVESKSENKRHLQAFNKYSRGILILGPLPNSFFAESNCNSVFLRHCDTFDIGIMNMEQTPSFACVREALNLSRIEKPIIEEFYDLLAGLNYQSEILQSSQRAVLADLNRVFDNFEIKREVVDFVCKLLLLNNPGEISPESLLLLNAYMSYVRPSHDRQLYNLEQIDLRSISTELLMIYLTIRIEEEKLKKDILGNHREEMIQLLQRMVQIDVSNGNKADLFFVSATERLLGNLYPLLSECSVIDQSPSLILTPMLQPSSPKKKVSQPAVFNPDGSFQVFITRKTPKAPPSIMLANYKIHWDPQCTSLVKSKERGCFVAETNSKSLKMREEEDRTLMVDYGLFSCCSDCQTPKYNKWSSIKPRED